MEKSVESVYLRLCYFVALFGAGALCVPETLLGGGRGRRDDALLRTGAHFIYEGPRARGFGVRFWVWGGAPDVLLR